MLPKRARGPRRTLSCALTVEQQQQFHRSSARYERQEVAGFEPTVLEQRTPMEMGEVPWTTCDHSVMGNYPPSFLDELVAGDRQMEHEEVLSEMACFMDRLD